MMRSPPSPHHGLAYAPFTQSVNGPNGGAIKGSIHSGARRLDDQTPIDDPATRIGAMVNTMSPNTQFFATDLGQYSYNMFVPGAFSDSKDKYNIPCMVKNKASSAQSSFTYASDSSSVQKSVANSVSVDASKFGIGISASASFNSLTQSGSTTTVSTYTTSNKNQDIQVSDRCIKAEDVYAKLEPVFLDAWNALPDTLDSNAAFQQYFYFVNGLGGFGTHFISKVTTGAAYMYISRSQSSYSYSASQMNTAICAGFKGTSTSIK